MECYHISFVFIVDIMAYSLVVTSALLDTERRLEVPADFLRRGSVSLRIQGVMRTFLVWDHLGSLTSQHLTQLGRYIRAVAEWQEVCCVYSIGPSCGSEDVLVLVQKPMAWLMENAIALMAVLTRVVLQASHWLCTA